MNSKQKNRQAECILAAACILFMQAAAAGAAGSTNYDAGIKAYQGRNYKLAVENFQKAVAGGNQSAIVLLYLGHSYLGQGDRAHAIETYKKLAEKFPSSQEAVLAVQCMIRLDPSLASKYKVSTAPAAATAGGTTVAALTPGASRPAAGGQKTGLIDRIIVFPPTAGHPAVSRESVETVRSVVQKIPKNMYQYLSDGGATINLVPNIEDKWPGSGDGIKPTDPTSTMGEEPGRTYNHDVHIYEREKVRGQNVLKDARPQSEIARICFHELGHAVDDISGVTSKSPQFMAALNDDLSRMPEDLKNRCHYYTTPMEAYAESLGTLMGNPDPSEIVQSMPAVKRYLKDKYHL